MISMGVKLNEGVVEELRRIGGLEDRSIGYLIRRAVTFWLTDYQRWEAERTGNIQIIPERRDHRRGDLQDDSLRLGQVNKGTGVDEGAHLGTRLNKSIHPAQHHLQVNVAPDNRLPKAAKQIVDEPDEEKS
jgi:hypothetical protein